MRYYFHSDDGKKYGPADVDTLNRWIEEDRIFETNLLEEEASGRQFFAATLPGLNFPIRADSHHGPEPPQYVDYPRKGQRSGGVRIVENEASADVNLAWVCGVFGFFCCPVLSLAALIFANRAISKGHERAQPAKAMAIVSLAVSSIGLLALLTAR